MDSVDKIIIWMVPLLTGIILHELAHGWVALQLGDPTARDAGRLTLNPISHIDPVGSVILPLILLMTGSHFLFGWAKPVPVNFRALRSPRRDMVLVAAAGPATNIILAILWAVLLHTVVDSSTEQVSMLESLTVRAIQFNIVIAVFNMMPIPPLDGGRVMVGLLPPQLARPYAQLERYGMLIVMVLLYSNSFDIVLRPIVGAFLSLLL